MKLRVANRMAWNGMAGNADSWVLNESLVHSFLHSSFVNRRSVKPMHHTASRLWLTSFALLGVVGLLGSFLNNHRAGRQGVPCMTARRICWDSPR